MKKKDYLAVGAFLTGLADLGLEALFMSDPEKWVGVFPFISPVPELPAGDDWIVGAGLPLVLYGLGHATKNQNLKDVGKGGGIYGACMLGHHTVGRTVYTHVKWPPGRVGQPAPFNIDYDFPTTNIIRKPRLGQFNIDWTPPAVTNVIRQARAAATQPQPTSHSGEFLPFQQDLGY